MKQDHLLRPVPEDVPPIVCEALAFSFKTLPDSFSFAALTSEFMIATATTYHDAQRALFGDALSAPRYVVPSAPSSSCAPPRASSTDTLSSAASCMCFDEHQQQSRLAATSNAFEGTQSHGECTNPTKERASKKKKKKKSRVEEVHIPENTPVRVSVGDGQWYPGCWRENTRTVTVYPPCIDLWGPVTFVRAADVALNDKSGNPMYLAANRKRPAYVTLIDSNALLYVFDDATQSLQPMHQEAIRAQARRKSSKSATFAVQK